MTNLPLTSSTFIAFVFVVVVVVAINATLIALCIT